MEFLFGPTELFMAGKYLPHGLSAGTNVEPLIRGCFSADGGGHQGEGPAGSAGARASVDCTDFVRWLKQEPQCLVWLPVLHRLASAESARHNGTKCKVCKARLGCNLAGFFFFYKSGLSWNVLMLPVRHIAYLKIP